MALDFNYGAGSALEAGDLSILDGLTEFSVSVWAWANSGPVSDHSMFGRDNGGSDFIRLFYERDGVVNTAIDNIPKIFIGVDSVQVRSEGGTNGMFTVDTWHHVCATCKFNQAAGLKIYFDGAVTGAAGDTTVWAGKSIRNIADSFYIGRRRISPQDNWRGKLTWFCIWDKELSAAEVARLSRGPAPWTVRPDAVIMRAALDGLTTAFHLPKDDFHSTLTAFGTVTPVPSEFPKRSRWLSEGDIHTQFVFIPPTNPWDIIGEEIHNPLLALQGFTDTTAVVGTTYKYRVRAIDDSANVSGPSNEAGPIECIDLPDVVMPPVEPGDPLTRPPMNVAQMRELFLHDVDDVDGLKYTRPIVLRFLNLAQRDLALEIDQIDENYFLKSIDYQVAATTGDLEFDLPPDFRKANSVERLGGTRPIPGRIINFNRRDRMGIPVNVVGPTMPICYLRSRMIGVVSPGDAYTLRLWYSHTLLDLVDDNDIPLDIPAEFHHLLVIQALKQAFPSEGGGFAPFAEEYGRELEMLRNSLVGRQREEPRYINDDSVDW